MMTVAAMVIECMGRTKGVTKRTRGIMSDGKGVM